VPRQKWASRLSFIFACVGSAVGLGNVWRFPYLSYRFGGGVFLIPYFLALALLGLPLLLLELGVGRMFKTGDVEAFGKIHPRLRGVGVMSILGSFFTVTYYVSIIAWSLVYFVGSFEDPMPWDADVPITDNQTCAESNAFKVAEDFLFNEVLRAASEEQLDAGKSHIISGYVYAGLVATWVCIFFCLAFGVKGVSKVVAITVPLPLLLLFVLMVYNLTLEGAGDGIDAYIGNWDFSDLSQKLIWPIAASQIFFSNSVGFGVMTAFGSFVGEESNLVQDTVIIALSNSGVSLLAGFVVYAIIGNVAHEYNCPNVDTIAESNGITLAFVTYPTGMLQFPDGVSNFMSAVFFMTLFTLGIDSAFSLVEALTTVLKDTPLFRKSNPVHITAYTCFLGFVISTLFATDVGLPLLDSMDHMLLTYMFLIIGFLKAVSVSWVYGWSESVRRVGYLSAAVYTAGYFAAMFSMIVLASALWNDMEDTTYLAVAIPFGALSFVVSTFAAFVVRDDKEDSFIAWWLKIVFTGSEAFRNNINVAATKYGKWRLHWVWDVIVKYLDPPILLGLTVNGIFSDATNTEGAFYNYPGWVQAVGILACGILILCFVFLAIFPNSWTDFFGEDKEGTKEVGLLPSSSDEAQGASKKPLAKGKESSDTNYV